MKTKALVLISGGLDSILAVKILMEQGIEVTGLTFVSNFFDADDSKILAKNLGIDLIDYNFSEEHLEIVKNPRHGYGKNMNPCIDCHGLMVRKAFEIMKNGNFDFIATGEVLGQRPKSQNKQALALVENYGEIDGYLLRPLCAKLLPETKMEKEGLVDRNRLLGIEGRNREEQIELARKYGIEEYPSPGGGCVLTYAEYSNKLRVMKDNWLSCDSSDVSLLRAGRIFWFDNILVVVGRHKEDNEKLEKLSKKDDLIFKLENEKGPFVLLRDKNNLGYKKQNKLEIKIPQELKTNLKLKDKNEIIQMAAIMTGYFVPKLRGKTTTVLLNSKFK